jgi:diguanylate cyclase (GGDEF)-like protein/PAS domain S-box-containing protein
MSAISYSDLFRVSPAASIVVDSLDRTIVDINEAAARMLGKTPSALFGKKLDEFLAESDTVSFTLSELLATPRAIRFCRLNDALGAAGNVELRAAATGNAASPRILLTLRLEESGKPSARKRPSAADDSPADALELADLLYQYSDEAMMVTDGRTRITAVNRAFTRLTGYTADDAIGRTPTLLRSGRQSQAFYREMWETLNATGSWQGQLINRRKNGDEYVERLTINAMRDQNGRARRYVALFSDISEKTRYDSVLWTQSNIDALTGLPNRQLLRQSVEQHLAATSDSGHKLALLSLDLDGFKEINDTLGHGIGDQVLVEAAKRLRACVRVSDVVARTGGDEFAIVLTELASFSAVETVGKKLVDALGEPFLAGAERIYLSASIGIATSPDDAESADALLATADQAMHAAKQSGRNRYQFFTRALHEQAVRRIKLIGDLREAIDKGQFELAFQPIVDLATGRIIKAEALLRWRHPQRGVISPADFIPVAESAGLIVLIGDWVFRQAAQWRLRWEGIAPQGFQISVNVSPAQFRLDEELPARWIAHCAALELPKSALVIEITEGLLLDAGKHSMDRLRAFRNAGMQIALDDFGTGYSGLSYLRSFDIDYIKIDQAFVREMHRRPADALLSEAIVAMAHKLGIKVVAEGIEEAAQRDLLARAGCDYGQGYLFSRPLAPQDFENLLANGPGACAPAARRSA